MRTFLILKIDKTVHPHTVYIAEIVKSKYYPSNINAFRVVEIPDAGLCHIELYTRHKGDL